MLRMLDPAPPDALRQLAERLSFRSLVLVVCFVRRPSVTRAATVYFPERRVPFTRLYEPKNRHPDMAPADQSSLCVEVPCRRGDATWSAPDAELARDVDAELVRFGWLKPAEIFDHAVLRMANAYPVLERGIEALLLPIFRFFERFENLTLSGRNGRFAYSHVHDQLRSAKDLVRRLDTA